MNNEKSLYCIIVTLFVSVLSAISIAEAYQQLRKPDNVYIKYQTSQGSATIGLYDYAAKSLTGKMKDSCFQQSSENSIDLLSTNSGCQESYDLFRKVVDIYEELLRETADPESGNVSRVQIIRVKISGKETLMSLSMIVDKKNMIVTSLGLD